jgi:hypothetical protein
MTYDIFKESLQTYNSGQKKVDRANDYYYVTNTNKKSKPISERKEVALNFIL